MVNIEQLEQKFQTIIYSKFPVSVIIRWVIIIGVAIRIFIVNSKENLVIWIIVLSYLFSVQS